MTRPTKRVALYLRVSTTEQTTDNQRLEPDAVIKRCGWKTVEVYESISL
jgi:DNA invertase Pin-like site-specific DNA recombinase